MKVVDSLKNIMHKSSKKEEEKETILKRKKDFVKKVNVGKTHKKTRENILIELKTELILKAVSEPYEYEHFKEDIRAEFDKDGVLSDIDMIAIECLYRAIKQGNMQVNNTRNNKISVFLKERENNIVKLINEMIKDANSINGNIHSEDKNKVQVENLIMDSYEDILGLAENIREDYMQEY